MPTISRQHLGLKAAATGNFGTPMMGVVVVLPDTDRER
jgi:hypothetical protein